MLVIAFTPGWAGQSFKIITANRRRAWIAIAVQKDAVFHCYAPGKEMSISKVTMVNIKEAKQKIIMISQKKF